MGIRSVTLVYALIAWIMASSLLVVMLNQQRNALESLDRVHHVGYQQLNLALKTMVHFKKQIQEWKNTLLRGDNRKDFQLYWSLFEQEEEKTKKLLNLLIEQLDDEPDLQRNANQFLEMHNRLGLEYRKAIRKYDSNNSTSAMIVDDMVRGMDREPTAFLDSLITDTMGRANVAHERVEEVENTHLENREIWGAILVFSWLILSGWLLAHWIIRPLSRATKIANKIGEGSYDTPIETSRRDEIGLLLSALESMQSRIRMDTDKLKQQRAEIEKALLEARAADIAKARFLSIVSHELRTPLNGISGAQQLLALQIDHGEQRDLLDVIEKSSSELLRLIDRILFFVDLEEGATKSECYVGNLPEWLSSIASRYEPVAAEKGIKLRLEKGLQVTPTFRLACRLVEIAVCELLDNAFKFSNKGEVTLAYEFSQSRNASYLQLSVRDDGSGIPTKILNQVSNQFQQADDGNSRNYGGIGLGLSLCQRIAKSLMGNLSIENKPDGGACVTLRVAIIVDGN